MPDLKAIDAVLSELADAVSPKHQTNEAKLMELRGRNMGAQMAAIKGKAYGRGADKNKGDPRSAPKDFETTANDPYWKKFREKDPETKKNHFDPTKLNEPQRLVRRSGTK